MTLGATVAQSAQWMYYRLDDRDSVPGRCEYFPIGTAVIPAMGPTQPPIQGIMFLLSQEVK
jgi:hypothetical protein